MDQLGWGLRGGGCTCRCSHAQDCVCKPWGGGYIKFNDGFEGRRPEPSRMCVTRGADGKSLLRTCPMPAPCADFTSAAICTLQPLAPLRPTSDAEGSRDSALACTHTSWPRIRALRRRTMTISRAVREENRLRTGRRHPSYAALVILSFLDIWRFGGGEAPRCM